MSRAHLGDLGYLVMLTVLGSGKIEATAYHALSERDFELYNLDGWDDVIKQLPEGGVTIHIHSEFAIDCDECGERVDEPFIETGHDGETICPDCKETRKHR